MSYESEIAEINERISDLIQKATDLKIEVETHVDEDMRRRAFFTKREVERKIVAAKARLAGMRAGYKRGIEAAADVSADAGRRIKEANKNMNEQMCAQKAAHKYAVMKVQSEVQRQSLKVSAVRRWIEANHPEILSQVDAVLLATETAFDAEHTWKPEAAALPAT